MHEVFLKVLAERAEKLTKAKKEKLLKKLQKEDRGKVELKVKEAKPEEKGKYVTDNKPNKGK